MSGRARQASWKNDIQLEIINRLLIRLGRDCQFLRFMDNIVCQTFISSFQRLDCCLQVRFTILELKVVV